MSLILPNYRDPRFLMNLSNQQTTATADKPQYFSGKVNIVGSGAAVQRIDPTVITDGTPLVITPSTSPDTNQALSIALGGINRGFIELDVDLNIGANRIYNFNFISGFANVLECFFDDDIVDISISFVDPVNPGVGNAIIWGYFGDGELITNLI